MSMSRKTGCFVSAILFMVLLSAKAIAQDLSGQWWLEKRSSRSETNNGGMKKIISVDNEIRFTLRYTRNDDSCCSYSQWNETLPIGSNQLRGLTESVFGSSGTKVEFDVIRDAGTFHCEGWFADGKGSGHYTFNPNGGFVAELVKRKIGAPTSEQLMRLAMNDTSIAFVDSLLTAGYKFDVAKLVRAANHGVSEEYVNGMSKLGYKPETMDQLIRMRDHGVDPEYVRELATAGMKDMPTEQIVKMRDHGVDASFIHGLEKYGIKGLDGSELARLRDHGVDLEFIEGFRKFGFTLSPQELIRLRDHGVDTSFASSVREAGFKDVTPTELVRLRDHGVDSEFIKTHGIGHSLEEIIRYHDRGGWSD